MVRAFRGGQAAAKGWKRSAVQTVRFPEL